MSRERPFFSVIIPAHNSAEFIRKGLESIKGQLFKDYEMIVVCDSCTDRTEEIARRYTNKVVCTDFHSCGGARNTGLDMAEGEWILFMDDDDYYLQDAFRKIALTLENRKDVDILGYNFVWKGMGVGRQSQARIYPAVWNKAWRREFIGDVRFPTWFHTEDVAFGRQLHPRARWAFLNEELYYYNFMREGSVSDRIRKGEYDNSLLPEEVRETAEGYEAWLKRREF